MQKQIIRQLQKSGNGYSVRVPPEVREDLQVNKQGDNVSFGRNPDSRKWEFCKVAPPNPGDGTHQNIENESETQSQQPEPKFEFCAKCGSPNIDVTGDKYYCHKCDVLYEFSAGGVIAIKLEPLSEDYEEVKAQLVKNESRFEQLEQNQNQLVGELNSAFGEHLDGEFCNGIGDNNPESKPKPKQGFLANAVEFLTAGIITFDDREQEDEALFP